MKIDYYSKKVLKQFEQGLSSKLGSKVQQRLDQLTAANILSDLYKLKSLCLEKLTGKRKDEYSIRVNKKYRICFLPANGTEPNNITEVTLTEYGDYHK